MNGIKLEAVVVSHTRDGILENYDRKGMEEKHLEWEMIVKQGAGIAQSV
jgi:hypothetical protein